MQSDNSGAERAPSAASRPECAASGHRIKRYAPVRPKDFLINPQPVIYKVGGVADAIVNGARQQLTAAAGSDACSTGCADLGVTGPKLGCGEGACGACTVLVGSRAVQACQVEAASVAGQRITTVEGLAEDGILHPVQQAWLEPGALQCGYCTPGWLTATAALLARVPHPTTTGSTPSWPARSAAAVPIRGSGGRCTAPPS